MLQQHITDFLSYCKVAGFSPKSIQSLTISLRDFKSFLSTQDIASVDCIFYGTLVEFVADFNEPSVHKKKARVWCMHQFFHFLTLTGGIRKNVASGLEYPKMEKTGSRVAA
jgi:site-specific recombinase XerD